MHERFLDRLENGLRKLESAMNTGHLRDEGVANRRLGRLLEKNWRAAGAFTVRIEPPPQPEGKTRLKITWDSAIGVGVSGQALRKGATSCGATSVTSTRSHSGSDTFS